MIFNSKRQKAEPGLAGICPICEGELIPKCGSIKIHHWAHKSNSEHCEHEPETIWHRQWKSVVPEDWVEVTIEKNGKKKRADILMPDGTVIELQHSPISTPEILIREEHYDKMIWIFDLIDVWNKDNFILRNRDGYHSFRWKYPRRSVMATTKKTFYDFGELLFELKKVYQGSVPIGGWGYIKQIDDFILRLNEVRIEQSGRLRPLNDGDRMRLGTAIKWVNEKMTPWHYYSLEPDQHEIMLHVMDNVLPNEKYSLKITSDSKLIKLTKHNGILANEILKRKK